jgi:hypothetical protein
VGIARHGCQAARRYSSASLRYGSAGGAQQDSGKPSNLSAIRCCSSAKRSNGMARAVNLVVAAASVTTTNRLRRLYFMGHILGAFGAGAEEGGSFLVLPLWRWQLLDDNPRAVNRAAIGFRGGPMVNDGKELVVNPAIFMVIGGNFESRLY